MKTFDKTASMTKGTFRETWADEIVTRIAGYTDANFPKWIVQIEATSSRILNRLTPKDIRDIHATNLS